MNAIATWARRAERLVSFAALAALTGSVLWGVLTRYGTEKPAVWTTELSGILFTWVVYIGAMTAHREGRHIRVSLLVDLLPPALRRAVMLFADASVLAFLAYVTWLSFLMMQKGATRPSPVLDIPFSWVYLATVIAFAGMTISQTVRLLDRATAEHPEDVL
ncbi:TRAP transporter small permease [Antarctobacter heliothermus]|uniref:TRAP transporter small permease protein n=1 Tax=Antarctobacter heliothermus TaxID=74033 RepID=A0A239FUF4_9RHOB|nr:TRAP transporter small permease [Antarctobacter heliothermus]SNS60459.1 TRAP-type C4-dicarboxylate transport system, small permease component [Antarctobacter heliothermus]